MRRKTIISLLTGAAAGMVGGFLGVGGGVVIVPMMVAYLGLTQHQAHGTSVAVIVVLALFGTTQYALHGYVDWALVAQLGVASAVGAILGAKLIMKLPAPQLRRIFGFFLLFAGIRLLIGTL